MVRKIIWWGLAVILAGFALIQLVPYGRDHTNPAVVQEPDWDSPQTRELAARACFDCHSNETTWPWYSSIAPVSSLVPRDVDQGRRRFNLSDWGQRSWDGDRMAKAVSEGEMPPWCYLPLHPQARLSDGEKQALTQGLAALSR